MSTPIIERRHLRQPVKLQERAGDPDKKTIVGYASVYYDGTPESEYQLWDQCCERILPGTFTRAIAEDDCRGLFNHDPNQVLGRTSAKTCRLFDDSKGLRYEIDPPDTQAGRDVITLLARGDVNGSSFSFQVTDQVWRTEDGIDIREIRGVKLYDVSPVTFPAYESTTAGVREDLHVAEARQAHEAWKASQDLAALQARQRRARALQVELELDDRCD